LGLAQKEFKDQKDLNLINKSINEKTPLHAIAYMNYKLIDCSKYAAMPLAAFQAIASCICAPMVGDLICPAIENCLVLKVQSSAPIVTKKGFLKSAKKSVNGIVKYSTIAASDLPAKKRSTKILCSLESSALEMLSEEALAYLAEFMGLKKITEKDLPSNLVKALELADETVGIEHLQIILQSLEYRSVNSIRITSTELLSEIAKTQGFPISDGLPNELKVFLSTFPIQRDGIEILKTIKVLNDEQALFKNRPTLDQIKRHLSRTASLLTDADAIWGSIGGNGKCPENFKKLISRGKVAEEIASHPHHITPGNYRTFLDGNFTTIANWIRKKNPTLTITLDIDPLNEKQSQYFKIVNKKPSYILKKWVSDCFSDRVNHTLKVKLAAKIIIGELVERKNLKTVFSKTGTDATSGKVTRKTHEKRVSNAPAGKAEIEVISESVPETQTVSTAVSKKRFSPEEWSKLTAQERSTIIASRKSSQAAGNSNGVPASVWKSWTQAQKQEFLKKKNSQIQQPRPENTPTWGAPVKTADKPIDMATILQLLLSVVKGQ
jgi:hypothetical protein